MEHLPLTGHESQLPQKRILGRIIGAIATAASIVRENVTDSWNQLKAADLNPHEGRLRGRVMPLEYVLNKPVPDYPPSPEDLA